VFEQVEVRKQSGLSWCYSTGHLCHELGANYFVLYALY